jgi:hypothetical protein
MEDNTENYIQLGLLKKVNMGEIVGEFMINIENYAKMQLISDDKNIPSYNEYYTKILKIEPNNELGLIIEENDTIDFILDYISVRLVELDNLS